MSGLLESFFDLLFGTRLPDGTKGVGAAVTIPLPKGLTGYSLAADRAAAAARLREACDRARDNPAWQPGQPAPGDTHCNGNADEVCQAFAGYTKLRGLMADQQIGVLGTDPDWSIGSAEDFGDHAQKGGLGFATVVEYPHGHLCPGYPDAPEQSDAWGGPEPMVSNVGESIGVMRLSGAFLLRQKPLVVFYLYKREETR